jgi:hypothetical protein
MGGFLKNHPQHADHLTNVLIGRVFDSGVGEMFVDLDKAIEKSRMMSVSA